VLKVVAQARNYEREQLDVTQLFRHAHGDRQTVDSLRNRSQFLANCEERPWDFSARRINSSQTPSDRGTNSQG
jgi:hypothetical protein